MTFFLLYGHHADKAGIKDEQMTRHTNTKLHPKSQHLVNKVPPASWSSFFSYYAISFSLLNPCPFSQFPQRSPPKFFSLGLSLKCRSTLSSAHTSENMPFISVLNYLLLNVLREVKSLRLRLREKFGEGVI